MSNLASCKRRTLLQAIAAAWLSGRLSTVTAAATGASPARLLERRIPSTGEMLPAIGLGTYVSFDVDAGNGRAGAKETLRLFADQGGTLVDSSPMYGRAERIVGELASELGFAGKLFLATKVWTTGREAGIRQMEQSMQRMGTQRMDLIEIHNLVDADTHAATLIAWKAAGRIRYWGVTHYHRGAYPELERFIKAARPDFLQINYSLAEPEAGRHLLPLARDMGIAVIVNRPFAQGDLFRAVRGKPLPDWAAEFAAASWAQFFLKWILADEGVTCVIPATNQPKHLIDNMTAGRGPLPDGASRARMQALVGRS